MTSIPFGYIFLSVKSISKAFRILVNLAKYEKTKAMERFGFFILRAHEDSNLGQRFWKPAFYH